MTSSLPKTNARLLAVQSTYAQEITGDGAATSENHLLRTMAESLGERPEVDKRFLRRLVRGATDHRKTLRQEIAQCLASDWTLDRVNTLVRALLMVATYELHQGKTPPRVVISEYTAIVRMFFDGEDEKEAGFVQAILDRIAKNTPPRI